MPRSFHISARAFEFFASLNATPQYPIPPDMWTCLFFSHCRDNQAVKSRIVTRNSYEQANMGLQDCLHHLVHPQIGAPSPL